jgi:hypothetical protein
MVNRILKDSLTDQLFKGKAIILYGPRQVGKTTLLLSLLDELKQKKKFLNCDEPDIRKELTEASSTQLKNLIGDAEVVVIDEAQRIKNIGLTLKLIIDQIKNVQLIASGSSALELSNELNEPLTGRKKELLLYPLSTDELISHTDSFSEKRLLETRLLYGFYPDVVNNPGNERSTLNNLVNSYLYKDIFNFQDIRKPELIENLLEALALQVGSQVSYQELARLLQIDQMTVRRYIDLLEKSFIIFRLRAFNRNVRNEIKKSRKIYFYDNGVRNAIIANFKPVSLRTDQGALWENFLISERKKMLNNINNTPNKYFWRTTQQQEIDYLEDLDGTLSAYEFKWGIGKKARIPKTFLSAYPLAHTHIVDQDNYTNFITKTGFEQVASPEIGLL